MVAKKGDAIMEEAQLKNGFIKTSPSCVISPVPTHDYDTQPSLADTISSLPSSPSISAGNCRCRRMSYCEDFEEAVQSSVTKLVPTSISASGSITETVIDVTRTLAEQGRRHTTFATSGRTKPANSSSSRRRLIQKTGDCNVMSKNVTKRKQKFLVDLFTTMVDLRWRWHAAAFVAAFLVTWLLFAIVWYVTAYVHGDVKRNSTSDSEDNHRYCVDHVVDFPSALLFSIETQSTIGYGYRVIQTECPIAIVILMLQSCIGLFIQALATGVIFAKISRPKSRAQTILFSRRAVVCKRDDRYFLLFRVGDMRRRSHIIGTSIRALLVRNRLTVEGESIPLCQSPLALETEASSSDSFVFLFWPATVSHLIDCSSPLWDLSADDLAANGSRFEIIVILEGTIESTGMLTQVRTSYLPDEIAWGERLSPLLTYQRYNGQYEIDYSQFHQTTPITMPTCSAHTWAERSSRAGGVAVSTSETPRVPSHLLDVGQASSAADYPYSFTMPGVRIPPASGSSSTQLNSIRHLFHRNRGRDQVARRPLEARSGEDKDDATTTLSDRKPRRISWWNTPSNRFLGRFSISSSNGQEVRRSFGQDKADGLSKLVETTGGRRISSHDIEMKAGFV